MLYYSCDCGEVKTFRNYEEPLLVPCDTMEFEYDGEEGDTYMWRSNVCSCSECGLYITLTLEGWLENCEIRYFLNVQTVSINGVEIIGDVTCEGFEEYHTGETEYTIEFAEHNVCEGYIIVERCSDCGKITEVEDMNISCNIDDSAYTTVEGEDGSITMTLDTTCPDCGTHFYSTVTQKETACISSISASMFFEIDGEKIFEYSQEEIDENHNFETTYYLYGDTCDQLYKEIDTCTECGYFEEEFDYGHNHRDKTIDLAEYGMCGGTAYISYCNICNYIHSIYNLNLGCSPDEPVDESYVDENGIAHEKYTFVCTECGVTISSEMWVEETPCVTTTYGIVTFMRDGEVLLVLSDRDVNNHHDYEYTYEFTNGSTCDDGVKITYHCKNCGYSYVSNSSGHSTLLQYKYESECGHYFEFWACPCGYSHRYNSNGGNTVVKPGYDYEIGGGNTIVSPDYEYGSNNGEVIFPGIGGTTTPDGDRIICSCETCGLFITDKDSILNEGCLYNQSYELTVKLGEEVLYEFKYNSSYYSHNYKVEMTTDDSGNTVITASCEACGGVASQVISNATLVENGNKYYYDFTVTPEESANYVIYSLASNDTYVELYQLIDGELKRLAYNDDGGYNSNFRLAYSLEAGETYVYRIRHYSSNRDGVIPYVFAVSSETVCNHNHNTIPVYQLAPGATDCDDGVVCMYVCASCGTVSRVESYYGHSYTYEEFNLSEYGVCSGYIYREYCTRCNRVRYCDVKLDCHAEHNVEKITDENGNVHSVTTQSCLVCGAQLIEDRYSETVGCSTNYYRVVTFKVGDEVIIDELSIVESTQINHSYLYSFEFRGNNCDDGYQVTVTCENCDYYSSSVMAGHQIFESERYELSELCGCYGDAYISFGACPCGEYKRVQWYHRDMYQEIDYVTDDNGVEHTINHLWCDNGFDITLDRYVVADGCFMTEYCAYTATMNDELLLDNYTVQSGTYEEHNYEYRTELHGTSCDDGYTVSYSCTKCGVGDYETLYGHNTYPVFQLDPTEVGCCEYHNYTLYACPCGYEYYLNWDTSYCECGLRFEDDGRTVEDGCSYTDIHSIVIFFGEEELYRYESEQTFNRHRYSTNAYVGEDGTLVFESVCSECGHVGVSEVYEVVLEANDEESYYYDLVFVPEVSGNYVITSMTEGDTYVELYQLIDGKYKRLASNDDGASYNNFRLVYNLQAGNTYVYSIRFLDQSKSGSIRYTLYSTADCSHDRGGSSASIMLNPDLGCEGGVIMAYVCESCGEVYEAYSRTNHVYTTNYVYLNNFGGCGSSYIELYSCDGCGKIQHCYTRFYSCSYTSNTEYVTDDNGVVHTVTTYTCGNCGMVFTMDNYKVKDETCTVREYRVYNLVIGDTVVIDNQTTIYSTYSDHNYEYEYTLYGDKCTDGYTITATCPDCGDTYTTENYSHEHYPVYTLDVASAGCCEHHRIVVNVCPCGSYFMMERDILGTCETCGLTVNEDSEETVDGCSVTVNVNILIAMGDTELYSKQIVRNNMRHSYELVENDGELAYVCSVCQDYHAIPMYEATMEEHDGYYYYDFVFTPEANGYYRIGSITEYGYASVRLYQVIDGELRSLDYYYSNYSYGNFQGSRMLEAGVTYVYRIECSNLSVVPFYFMEVQSYTSENCMHEMGYSNIYIMMDSDTRCDGGYLWLQVCNSCGVVTYTNVQFGHNYSYNYLYFNEYGGCDGSYIQLYGCQRCGKIQNCNTRFYSCNYTSNTEYVTDDNGVVHTVTTYTCRTCGMVFTTDNYKVKDETCTVSEYRAYNLVIGDTVVIDNVTTLYSSWIEHTYDYNFTLYGDSCEDGYFVSGVCSHCGDTYEVELAYHETYIVFRLNNAEYGLCDHHNISVQACPCGRMHGYNLDTWSCDECGLNVSDIYDEYVDGCFKTGVYTYTITVL